MRVAPKVTLTNEDRATFLRWARGRSTPARLVQRAQIILLAAENKQNTEIAAELGIDRTIVNRWRQPFAQCAEPTCIAFIEMTDAFAYPIRPIRKKGIRQ